jgi:hypothetical protein
VSLTGSSRQATATPPMFTYNNNNNNNNNKKKKKKKKNAIQDCKDKAQQVGGDGEISQCQYVIGAMI